MTLSPSLRKLALTTHVTTSVAWIGALAVFLAHAIVSVTSQDAMVVRAACLAMGLAAWFVIFPLSLASFASGLLIALGTAWGLIRHYWVLAKLFLATLATTVLLMKLAPIRYLSDAAAQATFSAIDLVDLRVSMLVHAIGGVAVLLTIATLAIYKPRGITAYGQRIRSAVQAPATSLPPWVKQFMLVAAALILALVIMLLVGEHGSGAHIDGH